MAEGDGTVLNQTKALFMKKLIDLQVNADQLKVALCKGALPGKDGSQAYNAVNEITAANYTAGGASLIKASQAVAQDDTNDRATYDAPDVTWTALGAPSAGALTYAAVYDDTTVTKYILAYWEITTQPNGGDFTLQWNAIGLLSVT